MKSGKYEQRKRPRLIVYWAFYANELHGENLLTHNIWKFKQFLSVLTNLLKIYLTLRHLLQVKLGREINVHFLLHEQGDPHFLMH